MSPRNTFILILLVLCVAGGFGLARTNYTNKPKEGFRVPGANIDWSKVVDDPNKKLTLNWMGIGGSQAASDGTWIQKMLEKRMNVEFKPTFLDWGAFTNRRPLIFCGGMVPDVYWEGDPLYVRRNIRQGFMLEIPYEVILKYAPTYVKNLNKYGRETWLYSYWRGTNWGLPTYQAAAIHPRPGIWRMDWLRNVGIDKVPETLDEMHEAMYRFARNDPDKNGKNDTYGMSPPMHWSLTFAEIFAAYGVLPSDFMLRDGKVVWGGVLPECKQVLALMQKWYSEGIIDPDYVIAQLADDAPGKKFMNGRVGYAYDKCEYRLLDPTEPTSVVSSMKELQPQAEVVPSASLIGVDGKRHGRVWGGAAHVICFGSQLEKEPEKVIRVLRMFEELAKDEDLFMEACTGKRGEHWDYSPEKGLFLLPPYDTRDGGKKNLLIPPTGAGFFSPCGAPLETTDKWEKPQVPEFRRKYNNPEWGIMNVLGKCDVVDSAGKYLDDLRNKQMTVFCEIIKGDKPVDYFDTFVKEWHEQGGDVLLKEANEMLKVQNEIYQKVGALRSSDAPTTAVPTSAVPTSATAIALEKR